MKKGKKVFSQELRIQKNIYRRRYGFQNNYTINNIDGVKEHIKEKNINIKEPLTKYRNHISNYNNSRVNRNKVAKLSGSKTTVKPLMNQEHRRENHQRNPVGNFKIFSYVL
jgi:hypothetical protein